MQVGFHRSVARLRIAAVLTLLLGATVFVTEGMAPICWMTGAVSEHDCCDPNVSALQRPMTCPSMGNGVDELAASPFQLHVVLAPIVVSFTTISWSTQRVVRATHVVRAEPRAPPIPSRIAFCSYLI